MGKEDKAYRLLYRDVGTQLNSKYFYIIEHEKIKDIINYFFIGINSTNIITYFNKSKTSVENVKDLIRRHGYEQININIPDTVLNVLNYNKANMHREPCPSDVIIMTFLLNYKDYELNGANL